MSLRSEYKAQLAEMEAKAIPIEESARYARELLAQLCEVDGEPIGEAVCVDCGTDGPAYTFAESRRPLCFVHLRARRRAGMRAAA